MSEEQWTYPCVVMNKEHRHLLLAVSDYRMNKQMFVSCTDNVEYAHFKCGFEIIATNIKNLDL